MSDDRILAIEGDVQRSLQLSFQDLAAIEARFQVPDVSQVDPKRAGQAVRFAGLLEAAGVLPAARYLTLHASADDFHASIPLEAVHERALVIYALDGAPLPARQGGPVRFFIPDFAACHTQEVDECANVKFVDRIELSAKRGYDNRPLEDKAHAELHERQNP